jgi:hypothetical protein
MSTTCSNNSRALQNQRHQREAKKYEIEFTDVDEDFKQGCDEEELNDQERELDD